MHKKNNVFKKWLAGVAMFGLVAAGAVFIAPAANAITRDASGGLEFNNDGDILDGDPAGTVYDRYSNVMTGTDAIVTVVSMENHKLSGGVQVTDSSGFDNYEEDSTDSWINAEIDPEIDRDLEADPPQPGVRARVTFRIDFVDSGTTNPVTLTNLRLHAYDIDNEQGLELNNVAEYRLTSDSILTASSLGGGSFYFLSENISGDTDPDLERIPPEVHSYGESRVQVNFLPTSSITLTLTALAGGSQALDFRPTGENWANASGAPIDPPAPTPATPPGPAPQVVAAIDVNPTNVTVDNEIITILGANLNTVTNVFIGGVSVPIFTQTGNRLQVRAPKGLSGPVDLELKSSLNDVLLAKKLNFGSTAAAGTRKATLIVGGFAHNSRKLTARMQSRIDRWLERNSDLGTLTCTGFTSLPRRTTDVTLSTNRGLTACKFSKTERPELETSVSQGIEDPRPGLNVRRVRLVLTP